MKKILNIVFLEYFLMLLDILLNMAYMSLNFVGIVNQFTFWLIIEFHVKYNQAFLYLVIVGMKDLHHGLQCFKKHVEKFYTDIHLYQILQLPNPYIY